LLFTSGAGMSADSGLPVFKDIANIEVYRKQNLMYIDLARPDWIENDPHVFYGFWGHNYNSYKDTNPNEGYFIIKSWRDKFFANNNLSVDKPWVEDFKSLCAKHYRLLESNPKEIPNFDPFFVYTSNVDRHNLKPGLFNEDEIYEIHGNSEFWQCSGPCTDKIWMLPEDFRFKVDLETMEAEPGQIHPDVNNHPRCECGALARPWILLFGDMLWLNLAFQRYRYNAWRDAMYELVSQQKELKVVILEVGAGINVPTIRSVSENILEMLPEGQCHLIRINLDFPHTGSEKVSRFSVPIMEKGLFALKRINEILLEKEKPVLN